MGQAYGVTKVGLERFTTVSGVPKPLDIIWVGFFPLSHSKLPGLPHWEHPKGWVGLCPRGFGGRFGFSLQALHSWAAHGRRRQALVRSSRVRRPIASQPSRQRWMRCVSFIPERSMWKCRRKAPLAISLSAICLLYNVPYKMGHGWL